jgi:acetyl esterase/lipase
MLTQTLTLHDDCPDVVLEAYVLKNSREFQTDVKRPAVIICPGGGYLFTSDREAEPVALRFLAQGYHAFVVRYSVHAPFPQALHDLARAVAQVRARAETWFIDSHRITVCGFSAGGHLAAALGVWWRESWLTDSLKLDAETIRPDALLLGYPVIDLALVNPSLRPHPVDPQAAPVQVRERMAQMVLSGPDRPPFDRAGLHRHVSSATPPSFVWHTADDDLVWAHNTLRFATALADHHVPYELHLFSSGVHGLSLADATTDAGNRFLNPQVEVWMPLALTWLSQLSVGERPSQA